MTSIQQGATTPYNLGPVKPWVQDAATWLGAMFGIGTVYGWRQSDPFPDHPSGRALDFMTSDVNTGDQLSAYAIANADRLGVQYIIWNREVWTKSQGWHPYTSTSNPHTDHVHITFHDNPNLGLPLGPRPGTGAAANDTCAWKLNMPKVGPVGGGEICIFSKPQLRTMLGVGVMLIGGATAVVGIILLMVYGLGQTKAASVLPAPVRRFI